MDTARQVIRWSIPGSILMLTGVLIDLLSIAWEHAVEGHPELSLDVTAPEVAVMTLASIPLGYLTYQFYYYRDGRVRRFPASLVPVDRGYAILRRLTAAKCSEALVKLGVTTVNHQLDDDSLERLPDDRRSVPSVAGNWPLTWLPDRLSLRVDRLQIEDAERRWYRRFASVVRRGDSFYERRRRDRQEFYERTQDNNQVVRTLLAVLSDREVGKAIVVEYTSLADLYHGLGATRTALAVGVPLGAVVMCFTPGRSLAGCGVAVVVGALIAFTAYWMVHRNRAQVLERLIKTTSQGLVWLMALDAPTRPPTGSWWARNVRKQGETPVV